MPATRLVLLVSLFHWLGLPLAAQPRAPKMKPVGYSQVKIEDPFWQPRLQKVASVNIPVCIEQTEVKTPRIRNFEKAARRQGETHEGIYYDDFDVYKAPEAMAYSLKNHPDAALDRKADEWIDKIAAVLPGRRRQWGQAWNVLLPDGAAFRTKAHPITSEPVAAIQASLPVVSPSADGLNVQVARQDAIAIPYYTWANRGRSPMLVWLPRKIRGC